MCVCTDRVCECTSGFTSFLSFPLNYVKAPDQNSSTTKGNSVVCHWGRNDEDLGLISNPGTSLDSLFRVSVHL